MTVSGDVRLTLSLSAAGGTAYIPIAGRRLLGLKLEAANAVAAGTLTFRLANDPDDAAPNAMTHPQVSVLPGTAINEFVDLIDLGANYLQVYWAPTVVESVTMTITISSKE